MHSPFVSSSYRLTGKDNVDLKYPLAPVEGINLNFWTVEVEVFSDVVLLLDRWF